MDTKISIIKKIFEEDVICYSRKNGYMFIDKNDETLKIKFRDGKLISFSKNIINNSITTIITSNSYEIVDNIITINNGNLSGQQIELPQGSAQYLSGNVVSIQEGYLNAQNVEIPYGNYNVNQNVVSINAGYLNAQYIPVGTLHQGGYYEVTNDTLIIPKNTYLAGELTIKAKEGSYNVNQNVVSIQEGYLNAQEIPVGTLNEGGYYEVTNNTLTFQAGTYLANDLVIAGINEIQEIIDAVYFVENNVVNIRSGGYINAQPITVGTLYSGETNLEITNNTLTIPASTFIANEVTIKAKEGSFSVNQNVVLIQEGYLNAQNVEIGTLYSGETNLEVTNNTLTLQSGTYLADELTIKAKEGYAEYLSGNVVTIQEGYIDTQDIEIPLGDYSVNQNVVTINSGYLDKQEIPIGTLNEGGYYEVTNNSLTFQSGTYLANELTIKAKEGDYSVNQNVVSIQEGYLISQDVPVGTLYSGETNLEITNETQTIPASTFINEELTIKVKEGSAQYLSGNVVSIQEGYLNAQEIEIPYGSYGVDQNVVSIQEGYLNAQNVEIPLGNYSVDQNVVTINSGYLNTQEIEIGTLYSGETKLEVTNNTLTFQSGTYLANELTIKAKKGSAEYLSGNVVSIQEGYLNAQNVEIPYGNYEVDKNVVTINSGYIDAQNVEIPLGDYSVNQNVVSIQEGYLTSQDVPVGTLNEGGYYEVTNNTLTFQAGTYLANDLVISGINEIPAIIDAIYEVSENVVNILSGGYINAQPITVGTLYSGETNLEITNETQTIPASTFINEELTFKVPEGSYKINQNVVSISGGYIDTQDVTVGTLYSGDTELEVTNETQTIPASTFIADGLTIKAKEGSAEYLSGNVVSIQEGYLNAQNIEIPLGDYSVDQNIVSIQEGYLNAQDVEIPYGNYSVNKNVVSIQEGYLNAQEIPVGTLNTGGYYEVTNNTLTFQSGTYLANDLVISGINEISQDVNAEYFVENNVVNIRSGGYINAQPITVGTLYSGDTELKITNEEFTIPADTYLTNDLTIKAQRGSYNVKQNRVIINAGYIDSQEIPVGTLYSGDTELKITNTLTLPADTYLANDLNIYVKDAIYEVSENVVNIRSGGYINAKRITIGTLYSGNTELEITNKEFTIPANTFINEELTFKAPEGSYEVSENVVSINAGYIDSQEIPVGTLYSGDTELKITNNTLIFQSGTYLANELIIFGNDAEYEINKNVVNIISGGYIDSQEITIGTLYSGDTELEVTNEEFTIPASTFINEELTFKAVPKGSYKINKNVVSLSAGYLETQDIPVGTLYSGDTSITPSKYNKSIPASSFLANELTIQGDANLLSKNIKEGVKIFGVSGSCIEEDKTIYGFVDDINDDGSMQSGFLAGYFAPHYEIYDGIHVNISLIGGDGCYVDLFNDVFNDSYWFKFKTYNMYYGPMLPSEYIFIPSEVKSVVENSNIHSQPDNFPHHTRRT